MLPWLGGVAALVLAGIGAAFMMRQRKGDEASTYTVTEEKE
jgi:hypothetical protein